MRLGRVWLSVLLAGACATGCKTKDGTPDATARTVWRAAVAGDGAAFRAMYPSEAELRKVFEPALAEKLLGQVNLGAAKVPVKPPRIQVSDVKVETEAEAPAGKGLLVPTRLARVRLTIKIPGIKDAEQDDQMALLRVGEVWRALPKEALSLVP